MSAQWQRGSIDRFPAAIGLSLWTSPRQKQQRDSLFVFSRTRALLFLVKKIFGRDENKIQIKLIFFLSILKAISSLKPAGEGETRTHVNKL